MTRNMMGVLVALATLVWMIPAAAAARDFDAAADPVVHEPVDPTVEGFQSLEEMEHFVRQQLQVPDDVAVEFTRVIEEGRPRLRISLMPRA